MNEAQRQQYLEAIGVETYMPRWVLPAAPKARRCEAPVKAVDVVREPLSVPSSSAEASGEAVVEVSKKAVGGVELQGVATPEIHHSEMNSSSSNAQTPETPAAPVTPAIGEVEKPKEPLIQLLDEASASPQGTAPNLVDAEEKVTSTESPAISEDVRFTLSLWRVSEDLLVIDSRQAELALPVDTLLINMLSALGYGQMTLPKVEVVRWPRVENAFSNKSRTAARGMLEAMLTAKLEAQPAKYLLLMGAQACYYNLPSECVNDASSINEIFEGLVGGAIPLSELNTTALVVPSLSHMLQNPESKRVTWQSIQPLRRS